MEPLEDWFCVNKCDLKAALYLIIGHNRYICINNKVVRQLLL